MRPPPLPRRSPAARAAPCCDRPAARPTARRPRTPPRGRGGPSATSSYRCIPTAARGSPGAPGSSFAQDAARSPEHRRDEEHERDDVAPFHREEEAADGDELGEDEGGDEAAHHVAEAA